MTKEEIDILEGAANQIDWLTKQNQLMATRLQMFDDVMTLVNINTNRGMSHSPGPTERIREVIAAAKSKLTDDGTNAKTETSNSAT